MKKALLVSTYGDFFWSFERDNINTLKEKGYDIYIVANFSEKKYNKYERDIEGLGINKIHIPFERSPFSQKTGGNFFQLKKIIDDISPQLVDCHLAVVGVLTRFACWNKKEIKVIYSPHGFFFYKGCPMINALIYKSVEHLMSRRTDALIVINSEDYINAKKMKVRGRVYYVPGVGVDFNVCKDKGVSIREELLIGEEEIVLLSVGELNKNKNHRIVLEALNVLSEKGVRHIHYVICGEGEERNSLLDMAKRYHLEDRLHLLGYREDVARIHNGTDVFVLPSYKEGLSVSIIEAMTSGLPIIASRIRGNVDLVDESNGGFLFAPQSIDDLVRHIEYLEKNKDVRDRMGSYNKQKSEKYSLNNVHVIMDKIYEDVINDE